MGRKPDNLSTETHMGQLGGEILPIKDYYAKEKVKSEVESRINLTGEAAKRAREDMAAYNDLKEKLEDARFDAEQSYGDPDAAQRVRDLEERLASYSSKQTEVEDAGATMKIERQSSGIIGSVKKFFGRFLGRK
jgi:predicted phage gp36 major capsid-like protein